MSRKGIAPGSPVEYTPLCGERVCHVRIGELRSASTGILKATLGSCVGLALIDRRARICGLAHCFLPIAPAGVEPRGARYADRAATNLLRAIAPDPTQRRGLQAYVAGGGRLLAQEADSRLQVGQLNLDAVRGSLKKLRIHFTEVNIGGLEGCTAVLNCDTGTFSCEKIGIVEAVPKELPWS